MFGAPPRCLRILVPYSCKAHISSQPHPAEPTIPTQCYRSFLSPSFEYSFTGRCGQLTGFWVVLERKGAQAGEPSDRHRQLGCAFVADLVVSARAAIAAVRTLYGRLPRGSVSLILSPPFQLRLHHYSRASENASRPGL
jgi:hypothetical protein